MKKPTLTPIAAYCRLRENDEPFEFDGFRYYLDAPQMCYDINYHYPVAEKIGDAEICFYPAGDEKVTDTSEWSMC